MSATFRINPNADCRSGAPRGVSFRTGPERIRRNNPKLNRREFSRNKRKLYQEI